MSSVAFRDQVLILTTHSRDEIANTLRLLPSGLEAEDIEDFCSLARYYAEKTPPSFRKVSAKLRNDARTRLRKVSRVSHR